MLVADGVMEDREGGVRVVVDLVQLVDDRDGGG